MREYKKGVAIGIEAGGTKTRAILVDKDGHEIARASSAGANFWDVGLEAARAALHIVINQLMMGGHVRAICLGAAGIDREADRRKVEASLRTFLPGRIPVKVLNDAAAALALLGPVRPAVAIVADTGSIAYGENADGKPWRAGGLGLIMGDAGSGVSIGLAALRHAADVLDGIARRGVLATAIIEQLELQSATDIVIRIQHPALDEALVESLVPFVGRAFDAGDIAAKEIVAAEADALARNARHVAAAVRDDSSLPTLLVGNVFAALPALRDRVRDAVKKTGPATFVDSAECVFGAARLALELVHAS